MKALLTAVSVLCLLAADASAAPVLTPAGLSPGDMYHLVFVTAGTRDATSSAIADYNAFVTTEAASLTTALASAGNPGVTWKAIGSTAAVDARDNIGDITSPIYGTDGLLVAIGEIDLFNGDIASGIVTNQAGGVILGSVWTGSDSDGTSKSVHFLGTGRTVAGAGQAGRSDAGWLDALILGKTTQTPLYAISSKLTVASPVPLPASAWMGLALMAALCVAKVARRLHA